MANEKTLPGELTLKNGQNHNANLIRANDEYLRDCIWVDTVEPTGVNIHEGLIWIDKSLPAYVVKVRTATSWLTIATITGNNKITWGLDANKGATPDIGDFYVASDTNRVYVCMTDDVWNQIYPSTVGMENNYLKNGGFENWDNGIIFINVLSGETTNFWEIEGTGVALATISKEITIKQSGEASLKCIDSGSGGGVIRVIQSINNFKEFLGKTLSVSIYVKADAASRVRAIIQDNIGSVNSSYNTTTGWEQLTVTKAIDSAATYIKIKIETADSVDTTFYIDEAMLVIGSQAVDYNPPDANIEPVRVSMGNFICPAGTGDYSITGIGYKPQYIEIFWMKSSATAIHRGRGWANYKGEQAYDFMVSQDDNQRCSDGSSKIVAQLSTAGLPELDATWKSMDNDGYTINFTTVDTDYNFYWRAVR